MFASLECRCGHFGMQVAGSGNDHGVDIVLAEQFPVVTVGTRVVRLCGALRGIAGGGVDIANRLDRGVGSFDQAAQMRGAPLADPDHAET